MIKSVDTFLRETRERLPEMLQGEPAVGRTPRSGVGATIRAVGVIGVLICSASSPMDGV